MINNKNEETVKVGSFKDFIEQMISRKSDSAELNITVKNKQVRVIVTIVEIN